MKVTSFYCVTYNSFVLSMEFIGQFKKGSKPRSWLISYMSLQWYYQFNEAWLTVRGMQCWISVTGSCLTTHIIMVDSKSKRIAAVWEQGAEENIWIWQGGSGKRLEKTA
jgi:hypothetical protein